MDMIAVEVAWTGCYRRGSRPYTPFAGAQLGTTLLWSALLTWPLMAAVPIMCARIGMVTGQGLAENFKQRFPTWLLHLFVVALLAANTIYIAADLAGHA